MPTVCAVDDETRRVRVANDFEPAPEGDYGQREPPLQSCTRGRCAKVHGRITGTCGKVRSMSSERTAKKVGVQQYLERYASDEAEDEAPR